MNFSSVDFALILLVLTLVTGALWCLDRFYARSRRAPDAPSPPWVEWGAAFFPVVLIVFGLRSFVVEPYKIPTGSMIPTLLVGDFIVVNKFAYGLRLPIVNTRILDIDTPKRGEVMVFRYPRNLSENYIKRVVGLPNDTVEYFDKRLIINGVEVKTVEAGVYSHNCPDKSDKSDDCRLSLTPKYTETLGETQHEILIEEHTPASVNNVMDYPFRENCAYDGRGFSCKVPVGHYLVMGDNRDNSADSRVWGFVPDENIVGRAFFIWFNFNDPGRIGSFR
ncbi:MAG: signal peptidase I [Betaproteobacteria bacterium]|nr:signal peptidase I [Betaproteobacteria bacterium]